LRASASTGWQSILALGLGFPKHAGGPLKYADSLGLDKVVELRDKYSKLGPFYRPSEKLRRMAAEKSRFHAS